MATVTLLPRPPTLPRDLRGHVQVSFFEQRVARLLVVIATLWFSAVAFWEIGGPILAGHYASNASMGIIAENMLRWEIAGPVWEYSATKPLPSQYYCHHPWGIFWLTTAFMKLFGRHDFVCRLPAILLSCVTPALLFVLGRALWRPAAGACAAVAFVVLPISLSFAHFNALEVPVIAWSCVGLWAYVRHERCGRRRYLVLSLCGFGLALHADWPAYVLLAVLLGYGLLRYLWPRRFGRFAVSGGERSFGRWWAWTATLCVATALLYVALFYQAGQLDDLVRSYRMRSSGAGVPLAQVLESRRYWIELMFTPAAILVGKIAAVVCLLRLLWRRDAVEVVPLACLIMALFQYLVFKQGADIHVFWPHYFALFFALGVGALVATSLDAVSCWRRSRSGRARDDVNERALRLPLAAGAGLLALVLLTIARDGIEVLGYARATGGRFNEKGLPIESDGDKIAFLRWLAPQLSADRAIALHSSMRPNWAHLWALGGRPVKFIPQLRAKNHSTVVDARYLRDGQQQELLQRYAVRAAGPFWLLTGAAPNAPSTSQLASHRFEEREPDLWQWYTQSAYEPQRQVLADPFHRWEWLHHFQQPTAAPTQVPTTFEQQRIAHNMALASGDTAAAERLRHEVVGALRPLEHDLGTTRLLGVRLHSGARNELQLLFLAQNTVPQLEPQLRGRIVRGPRWSTTMADPTVRQLGAPLALKTKRWKPGYLYSYAAPIRRRPGAEIIEFSWGRVRPISARGSAKSTVVEVLRLP